MNSKNPRHFTIPVFIPELACPNRCSFCNQNKITGKPDIPKPENIVELIQNHLSTMPEHADIEMGFFGGNFTGIPIHEQIEYLQTVQPFIKSGKIKGIRISTRPDYISVPILEMLNIYNVKTIEIGAQSLDDGVLEMNRRGHSSEDVAKAAELIKSYKFNLGIQMMTGLPGDTMEKTFYTACEIIRLGADETRIYPALVIKGTLLEDWFLKGYYRPLTIDEAIKWINPCIIKFHEYHVKILRVGLHPSEGLQQGRDLTAGPYHPSLRELAYTQIWNDLLKKIEKCNYHNKISIFVATQSINVAIGYKAANRKMLLESFNAVDFYGDSALKCFEFYVNNCRSEIA